MDTIEPPVTQPGTGSNPAVPAVPATPTAPPASGALGRLGQYRPLPGRVSTIRRPGVAWLYLGDTELVQMNVVALREVYSRFAFKDIQAIEVSFTNRGVIYNWILGVIMALCLFGAVLSLIDRPASVVFGIITGFFGVLLLVNVLRGQTCRCTVKTATGQHTLRSLVRLRSARRALALIAEQVEKVQGSLDQNTAARQMDQFLAQQAARQAQRTRAASPPPPPPTSSPPSPPSPSSPVATDPY